MEMPPDILTLLLRGGHLNVEERKAMGLWPNETLAYGEVLSHLTELIEKEDWFPFPMPPYNPGEAAYEGTVIQRVFDSKFVCHSQRTHGPDPTVVAERSEKIFNNARDAAEFYLKWELGLPGRLDGWVVE